MTIMTDEESRLDAQKEEELKPKNVVFTIPNFVSLLRLISIPVISCLIYREQMWAALVVLAFSGLTDGLDGFLARRLHQVSKLGQLLDPIADRLLILCTVLAFGLAGLLPWWLLGAIALRDFIMAIEVVIIAQYDYGPLPVNFVGKVGTALLMIAIPCLIVADISKGDFFTALHLLAVAGVIWGVVCYWVAGGVYLKQGYDILRLERTKKAA